MDQGTVLLQNELIKWSIEIHTFKRTIEQKIMRTKFKLLKSLLLECVFDPEDQNVHVSNVA